VLFFHHQLDRQAVAIPARHIGRIKTAQGLGFDDDVLQDFVDGMTDMNIPVGIRRAIMQDEFLLALTCLADALVKFFILLGFQPAWLTLGEIATHGEAGFRQVKRVFGFVGHERVSLS
jgi:hypothetical protein